MRDKTAIGHKHNGSHRFSLRYKWDPVWDWNIGLLTLDCCQPRPGTRYNFISRLNHNESDSYLQYQYQWRGCGCGCIYYWGSFHICNFTTPQVTIPEDRKSKLWLCSPMCGTENIVLFIINNFHKVTKWISILAIYHIYITFNIV